MGGTDEGVYFEEGGAGHLVVLLHTGGADTRQWRFVLNDEAFTAQRRFIAFDMPWHGKSLPPEGFATTEYLLTTEPYIDRDLAFCNALGLERPPLVGCSMGGGIPFQLPALHPNPFFGFIAIGASAFHTSF